MIVLVIHRAYESVPLLVAKVKTPEALELFRSLEFAYRHTQNTDGSWSKGIMPDGGPCVTRIAPLHTDKEGQTWGLRSTSVGDQMIVGDKFYEVASCGFTEIHK